MSNLISAQIRNNINIFLNRYFSAIIFVASVVVLVAGFSFLLLPKYKEVMRGIESAGAEYDSEYSEMQKYLSELKKLKNEFQKISQEDIAKIQIMLPQEEYHEELLAQMENIVLKNGFLLTFLQVEDNGQIERVPRDGGRDGKANDAGGDRIPLEVQTTVNQVKIKMDIVGADYSGLKKLLGIIENNLRLIDILNISFDPTGGKTSLEMRAYYIKSAGR